MILKKHFFFSLLICNLFVVQISVAQEGQRTKSSAVIDGVKYYLHTVEKGQTLFAIAKIYNRDVNSIVIENPEAIDGIKPGQVLKISFEKKTKTEIVLADTTNYIYHKVEKGQTLYSISKQYGITDEKLKFTNPELQDGLKIGQTIKIPTNKKKTEEVKVAIEKNNATVANDITKNKETEVAPTTYESKQKSTYNIAFFLPFHADEANAIELEKIENGQQQLSSKTALSLQFYEGALLAIDSLKKQKLNAKIFTYDIDDKDSLTIVNLLKKPELASMDLMIGPLYVSSFMPVANYAKEHSIAIVSPFTQLNKILFNNPYVFKALPSTTLQITQMAHFVVDTFHTQNIILINNGNLREVPFINAFQNTANEDFKKAGYPISDSVKEAKGLGALENLLTTNKTNIVVLPSNNQSYVTEFTSRLNVLKDKYKIILFGMQNWMTYDNLDIEYLNNLSLHFASNNFVDYENAITKMFIKNYRDKYKTEPELYAYQGFDISYYFISLLKKYGTGFMKYVNENNFKGIETNYNFSQYPLDSGFENKFVYILKCQDYKLMKAN